MCVITAGAVDQDKKEEKSYKLRIDANVSEEYRYDVDNRASKKKKRFPNDDF